VIAERYKDDGKPTWRVNQIQATYKQQLLDKLRLGEYKTEMVSKCCCSSELLEVLAEKDRFGLPFGSLICKKCGLILTSPRLAQRDLPSFYNHEYHGLHFGETEAEKNPYLFRRNQGVIIFEYVKDFLNKDELLVAEVGCGSGANLSSFATGAKRLGIRARLAGCEYSESYASYANSELGIAVCMGGASTLVEEGINADVLILSHVFEHFIDLEVEMKAIENILKDDGILYIEVPGILDLHNKYEYDCDFLKYLTLAHMYNFSLTTLRSRLATVGFSLVKGDEYVRSVFMKSSVDTESLTGLNDYDRIVCYLTHLEKNKGIYASHNPNRRLHRRAMHYLYRQAWIPRLLRDTGRKWFSYE
jgi:SAM-dependent methyltransferase